MSAPTASVLLPKPLTDLDRQFVDHLMSTETRTIGNLNNPFYWSYGLSSEVDIEDFPALTEAFGFTPVDEIFLSPCVKGSGGSQTLGEFCAILSERFGGIVDFHGNLCPLELIDESIDYWSVDWQVIEPLVSAALSKLPGRVVALAYEVPGGRQWACHYGDAEFMRAWLRHPYSGLNEPLVPEPSR